MANYSNEVENLAKTVALGVRIANNDENYEGIKEAMQFVTNDHRLKFVSILEDTSVSSASPQKNRKYAVFKTIPDKAEADTLKYPPGSIIVKSVGFTAKTMSGAILLAFSTEDINKSKMRIRITSLLVSGGVFLSAF